MPGYRGAVARLVINRAKLRLEDQRPRFRSGGILIKSKHAIHEATLFAPELENDPHAKWFLGKLICEYIDQLWNEFDDRFEEGLDPTPENPRLIHDPMRKVGLTREHPFVDALFKEALKRLRPLVEAERRKAESQQARIESEDTRRRLKALEKAAAKFMSEHRDDEGEIREVDDVVRDSSLEKNGFSLIPSSAQVTLGNSVRFWLNVKQDSFPELAVGDSVEISCATDEISCSKRFALLEVHPNRAGVLRCFWSIRGEQVTKSTAVKARVGPIVATSEVEVIETEKDRYRHVNSLCFSRKQFSIETESSKTITLYAPCPEVVAVPTPVDIRCSEGSFKILGDHVLIPRPELGIAVCKLRVSASKANRSGRLTAAISTDTCSAELFSLEPKGPPPIKIEFDSGDYRNQRSFWRGNTLLIAAKHPSLSRYLGPPTEYPGQEEKHFRVLLAEIVADALCASILSKNTAERENDYEDYDWDAYYADYTKLMTEFLPIAHDTQVKL